MFRLIKVTGESLSPFLKDGDYVLITTAPFLLKRINRGDLVVFHHDEVGMMIKKVAYVDPSLDALFVLGTHPSSVDSKQLGPISNKSVIGKVIWHIPSPV
jgi:nickel-type superoxide dismutase maturation protease